MFPLFTGQKQRDPADETIEGAKKQAKPKKLSKVAEAKKLHRMKIAVNTKKVFDEEGEVMNHSFIHNLCKFLH